MLSGKCRGGEEPIGSGVTYVRGEDRAANMTYHQRCVEIIQNIPRGKVTTYGQIAALAGNPRGARQVSRILHSSSEKEGLPWHRVINSKGGISLERDRGYELQKTLLEQEGVEFNAKDFIDLKKYRW